MTANDPPGRRARFEALVEVVYEPLQRYARRRCDPHAADDVVADALLVLWRRLDDVPDGAELPWCYRVAANCLANHRRGAQRSARLVGRISALDPPVEVDRHAAPPDPLLHAALATLAPADQEVLRLWAWEGLAPAEIALVLEVSANAVSIRLHRAKARLGEALERTAAFADTTTTRTRREVT